VTSPQGSVTGEWAGFINGVHRFVVTSSPRKATWHNDVVVDGRLADVVADVKFRSGGDIGVHGSIEVAHGPLAAGFIDELRLVIARALQVRGRRLFDEGRRRSPTPLAVLVSQTGSLLLDSAFTA
jgi:dihydrofolate reductase